MGANDRGGLIWAKSVNWLAARRESVDLESNRGRQTQRRYPPAPQRQVHRGGWSTRISGEPQQILIRVLASVR